jgi:polar amino acid transport system substrate-binding protein
MRRPRALALILIGLFVVLTVAAAGWSASAGTLESVQKNKKVRVGIRFDNPPLSYIDDRGRWVGFDVALAHELVKKMGHEIELVKVDETTRISFLQQGKIDMAVASMNHTRSRDKAIDFSVTYFWDNQSFLVRTGTYNSLKDLLGKKVAANAGSSALRSWRAYSAAAGGPPPVIVEFTDKLAAVQAVRDGAVEGYTEDGVTLLALAAGDRKLKLVPGGHNVVQYGIGLPRNDSEWRHVVNVALQDLWKEGLYQSIYQKWFESDMAMIKLPLGGRIEVWAD